MGWRRWPAAVVPCVVLTVGWAQIAESKAVPRSQRAALPWNDINVVVVTEIQYFKKYKYDTPPYHRQYMEGRRQPSPFFQIWGRIAPIRYILSESAI
jgi:hypothetical protein